MIRSCAAPKHKRTHSAARPCKQLEVSCSHKGYIWLWLSVLKTSSSPHLSSVFTAPCMQPRCSMLFWLRGTMTPPYPGQSNIILKQLSVILAQCFIDPIWTVVRNLTFERVTSLLNLAYSILHPLHLFSVFIYHCQWCARGSFFEVRGRGEATISHKKCIVKYE